MRVADASTEEEFYSDDELCTKAHLEIDAMNREIQRLQQQVEHNRSFIAERDPGGERDTARRTSGTQC